MTDIHILSKGLIVLGIQLPSVLVSPKNTHTLKSLRLSLSLSLNLSLSLPIIKSLSNFGALSPQILDDLLFDRQKFSLLTHQSTKLERVLKSLMGF